MFWLLTGLSANVSTAQEPPPSIEEYKLKTAFIYNFAKFTVWTHPEKAGPEDGLLLCLAAEGRFMDVIGALENKLINGRPFQVKTCQKAETAAQAHILFVNTDDRAEAARMLHAVQGEGVLTIGEMEGFAAMGGIINFYKVNKKIRFEVNVNALERSNVRLSSHVLKLARIVEE